MSEPTIISEKQYVEQELLYLYEKIQDYSRTFPDTAAKLNLTLNGSDDPHIQLMLESFAILTSKLQKQIDQSTYPITSALLDNLHPSGNAPIPCQSIVQFSIDETQIGSILNGFKIPKNTIVYKNILEEECCHFSTEWDLNLLPVEIKSLYTEAGFSDSNQSNKGNIVIELKALKC